MVRKLEQGEVQPKLKTRRDRIDDFDDFMMRNHKPGCGQQVEKYLKWLNTYDFSNEEFLKLVDIQECECWVWLGEVNDGGQPFVVIDNIPRLSRRLAWQRFRGRIYRRFWIVQDPDMCSNSICISPWHSTQVKPDVARKMLGMEDSDI